MPVRTPRTPSKSWTKGALPGLLLAAQICMPQVAQAKDLPKGQSTEMLQSFADGVRAMKAQLQGTKQIDLNAVERMPVHKGDSFVAGMDCVDKVARGILTQRGMLPGKVPADTFRLARHLSIDMAEGRCLGMVQNAVKQIKP